MRLDCRSISFPIYCSTRSVCSGRPCVFGVTIGLNFGSIEEAKILRLATSRSRF
ncbi:unnamed protein product [Linum tenue]|uniref:Uncharacterized protein n=1 Tax=Linum tenue TaxID=586396 RepID=A0AAV0QLC1_9ROSI|nr:unnamed protein product [Linum tenue]